MVRLCALSLLVPALAVAAPVPKGKEAAPLYHPTTVGDVRVVEVRAGGVVDEVTETVTRVEDKGGAVLVTSRLVAKIGRVGVSESAVHRVSAGGVSAVAVWGVEAKEPPPLLKAGKPGDTWAADLPGAGGGPGPRVTYTLRAEEQVEVPAGKFTAVRVEVETAYDGGTHKGTTWYAAGVGVVKSTTAFGGATLTHELKAFTPGDGKAKDEPKKDK